MLGLQIVRQGGDDSALSDGKRDGCGGARGSGSVVTGVGGQEGRAGSRALVNLALGFVDALELDLRLVVLWVGDGGRGGSARAGGSRIGPSAVGGLTRVAGRAAVGPGDVTPPAASVRVSDAAA